MAEPIGALRALLSLDWASFEQATLNAAKATNNFGKTFKSLNRDLEQSGRAIASIAAPIGAAMAAVGGAIALATYKLIDQSSALVDMADKSGHTVEWLEKTGYAAGNAGSDIETLTTGSKNLQKALGEGSVEGVAAMNALGLSFSGLRDSSPDEAMQKVLVALGKVPNQADATALAMKLLGKSGTELLPLSRDIEALQKRAEELGLVMGDQSRRNAEALGDSIGDLESAFGGLSNQLASLITDNASVHALINGLADVFGTLSGKVKDNKGELSNWVTSGAIMAADGLITLSKASGIASTAWDALQLVWRGAYHVGLELSLLLQKGFIGWGNQTDAQKAARAETEAMIRAIEGEIAANSEGANKAVEAGQKRQAAIAIVTAELEKLKLSVAAAAGKNLELAGSHDHASGAAGFQTEAEKKLAEQLEKTAKKSAEAAQKSAQAISDAYGASEDRLKEQNLIGTDARIEQNRQAMQKEIDGYAAIPGIKAEELAVLKEMSRLYWNGENEKAKGHFATVALAADASGFTTRAALETTASRSATLYSDMLASGKFTYGQLVAAGQASADAQRLASGGTALSHIEQLRETARIANEAYMAITRSAGASDDEIKRAHLASVDATKKVDEAQFRIRMGYAEMLLSASSGAIRAIFSRNKSTAIAAGIIDTAAAVLKALGSAPPPINYVLAGLVGVAGLAEVNKIRSQDAGFAEGTPGTSFVDFGRETWRPLHGMEAVVNQAQGKSLAALLSGTVRNSMRGMLMPGSAPASSAGGDSAALMELRGLRDEQRAFRSALPTVLRDAVMLARA